MTAADDVLRARRYLLGQATPQEATEIEEDYLADDAAIARIAAVEDSLIDDYLEGQLGLTERHQFEQSYLASPRHRARVDAVRRLRAAAVATPHAPRGGEVQSPAADTCKRQATVIRWKPWLALAATLVLVTFVGTMLSRTGTSTSTSASVAPSDSPASETSGTAPAPAAPSSPSSLSSGVGVLALSLAPIGVRGAAEAAAPPVPEVTTSIMLHLQRDANTPPFTPARVIIRSMNGEERWSGPVDASRSTASADSRDAARVDIPGTLSPDDYLVTLMAAEPRGGEREWLQYLLRIRRP